MDKECFDRILSVLRRQQTLQKLVKTDLQAEAKGRVMLHGQNPSTIIFNLLCLEYGQLEDGVAGDSYATTFVSNTLSSFVKPSEDRYASPQVSYGTAFVEKNWPKCDKEAAVQEEVADKGQQVAETSDDDIDADMRRVPEALQVVYDHRTFSLQFKNQSKDVSIMARPSTHATRELIFLAGTSTGPFTDYSIAEDSGTSRFYREMNSCGFQSTSLEATRFVFKLHLSGQLKHINVRDHFENRLVLLWPVEVLRFQNIPLLRDTLRHPAPFNYSYLKENWESKVDNFQIIASIEDQMQTFTAFLSDETGPRMFQEIKDEEASTNTPCGWVEEWSSVISKNDWLAAVSNNNVPVWIRLFRKSYWIWRQQALKGHPP